MAGGGDIFVDSDALREDLRSVVDDGLLRVLPTLRADICADFTVALSAFLGSQRRPPCGSVAAVSSISTVSTATPLSPPPEGEVACEDLDFASALPFLSKDLRWGSEYAGFVKELFDPEVEALPKPLPPEPPSQGVTVSVQEATAGLPADIPRQPAPAAAPSEPAVAAAPSEPAVAAQSEPAVAAQSEPAVAAQSELSPPVAAARRALHLFRQQSDDDVLPGCVSEPSMRGRGGLNISERSRHSGSTSGSTDDEDASPDGSRSRLRRALTMPGSGRGRLEVATAETPPDAKELGSRSHTSIFKTVSESRPSFGKKDALEFEASSAGGKSWPTNVTSERKVTEKIPSNMAFIKSSTSTGRLETRKTGQSKWQQLANKVVEQTAFDCIFTLMIVANAIVMGAEADLSAKQRHSHESMLALSLTETFFAAAFALELTLRFYASRLRFFTGPGSKWAFFDTVLVVMSLSEEIIKIFKRDALFAHPNENSGSGSMSYMRVLRMVRMVRILRMFRILQFVNELSVLANSILNCTRSLFWTIMLLMIMIYALAVYFTSISLGISDPVGEDGVNHFFGGLTSSMMTLYQSMSGGVDWGEVSTALITQISALQGFIFAIYIAFMVLALTNVVTGVFVEGALKSTRSEDAEFADLALRELFDEQGFARADVPGEDFLRIFHSTKMQSLLARIGVDTDEAGFLVSLLDMNGNGEINREEFIGGCIRIRGHAKAIDTLLLLHDLRTFVQEFRWFREEFDNRMNSAPCQSRR